MRMGLRDRRGSDVPAQIDVVPIPEGPKLAKVLSLGLGGIILGVATAFIPPHVPQLILLPSAGLFLAVQINGQKAKVGAIHATCPKCQAAIDLPGEGKVWSKDCWIRCAGCQEPYRVELISG